MKKFAVVMMSLGLWMSANAAHSAVTQGQSEVSMSLGSAISKVKSDVSNIDLDMGKPGIGFAAGYLYSLTPQIGLGAELGYYSSSENKMSNFPREGATVKTRLKTFNAELVGRYLFLPEKNYHFHVLAGFGYANVREEVQFQPLVTFREFQLFSETGDGLSASLGAGFDYEISPNWNLGLNMRWRYIALSHKFTTVTVEPGNFQSGSLIHFGLSVTRKFGGK